jgi:cyclopropane-fatty-acyl-phospholipid synthase
LIAKGDIGLTEAYRDNWWETDNLVDLLKFALQNASTLDSYVYGSTISNLVSRILYSLRSNTLNGSKRNIHAHYDLSNDLFKTFLDKDHMMYSCAIFDAKVSKTLNPSPVLTLQDSLENAQKRKSLQFEFQL